MIDLVHCQYMDPGEIHFSQDTIACNFIDGKRIGRTLDQLVDMEVFATDIPPISVAQIDDKYFTRNNRRLWVFRQLAMMRPCTYIPVLIRKTMPEEQFTTDVGGNDIQIRGEHGSTRLKEFEEKKRVVKLHQKTESLVNKDAKVPFTATARFKQVFNRKTARGRRRLPCGRRVAYTEPLNFRVNRDNKDASIAATKPAPKKRFNNTQNSNYRAVDHDAGYFGKNNRFNVQENIDSNVSLYYDTSPSMISVRKTGQPHLLHRNMRKIEFGDEDAFSGRVGFQFDLRSHSYGTDRSYRQDRGYAEEYFCTRYNVN